MRRALEILLEDRLEGAFIVADRVMMVCLNALWGIEHLVDTLGVCGILLLDDVEAEASTDDEYNVLGRVKSLVVLLGESNLEDVEGMLPQLLSETGASSCFIGIPFEEFMLPKGISLKSIEQKLCQRHSIPFEVRFTPLCIRLLMDHFFLLPPSKIDIIHQLSNLSACIGMSWDIFSIGKQSKALGELLQSAVSPKYSRYASLLIVDRHCDLLSILESPSSILKHVSLDLFQRMSTEMQNSILGDERECETTLYAQLSELEKSQLWLDQLNEKTLRESIEFLSEKTRNDIETYFQSYPLHSICASRSLPKHPLISTENIQKVLRVSFETNKNPSKLLFDIATNHRDRIPLPEFLFLCAYSSTLSMKYNMSLQQDMIEQAVSLYQEHTKSSLLRDIDAFCRSGKAPTDPFIPSLIERIFDPNSNLDDIHSHDISGHDAIGSFFNSIGIQARPRPNRRNTIVIFVLEGLSWNEIASTKRILSRLEIDQAIGNMSIYIGSSSIVEPVQFISHNFPLEEVSGPS